MAVEDFYDVGTGLAKLVCPLLGTHILFSHFDLEASEQVTTLVQ
jgi:hypothetical protein